MKVITDSSEWHIDEDAMIVTRFPRNGEGNGKDHTHLSYKVVGTPMPYLEIERGIFHGGDRFKITTEDRSKCCYTGQILEVL